MSVHYVPAKAGGRAPTPDILGAVLTGEEQNAIETKEIMDNLVWDYTQAGPKAKAVIEHTVELKRSERRASEAIIEAGKHLMAVQELMPHGTWLDWLTVEFKMSQRTAYNMIGIAKRFDGKVAKIASLAPSVLYLLAGDSVPEEAREEVIQRSQSGERVTVATAKAVIEEHKPKQLYAEQINEFLRMYWRGADLQAVADCHDPRGVLRGLIVQNRSGGAGGRFRYQTMSGKVECWDGGNYFDRPADAVWTYDQFAKLSLTVLPEPKVNTAPAPVVVDMEPESEPGNDRPTHEMLVAKFTIWKWLVEQCGPADFKGMVELAEALHYQEASHPLWFKMYPKGADIDDVFWGLETCIDEAAGLVPEYKEPAAVSMPVGNLKAAVIYWLRENYPDYYGQVAALQCMIADPMHDEDVQRMEPTLPTPYRKDDLLVAMMQASAYLDSLKDEDEPEEADTSIPHIPNPNWEAGRQPDPEPEHDLDCYDDTLARPAARRMNRLHTLKVRFQETIDLLPEFSVLTGHYVNTNPAKRALRELIETLDNEMNALWQGVKEGAEG